MYQGLGGAIQGKELRPPLLLGVVAIEKGAFWSPSTTVALDYGRQLYFFTYLLLKYKFEFSLSRFVLNVIFFRAVSHLSYCLHIFTSFASFALFKYTSLNLGGPNIFPKQHVPLQTVVQN